jgi:hypothetical protein
MYMQPSCSSAESAATKSSIGVHGYVRLVAFFIFTFRPYRYTPPASFYLRLPSMLVEYFHVKIVAVRMADPVTILGGVAATAQLSVYGYRLLAATAGLPRKLRKAPDSVQIWLNQAATMIMLLDDAQSTTGALGQGLACLFDQCRNINARLSDLLQPRQNVKRNMIIDFAFILRRRSEVEELMVSFGNSFQMLALNLIL